MEGSWADVAKVLSRPVRREDRQSVNARMEAYLTLNELVEEPDTTARMDAISAVLPLLVRAIQMDLHESTDAVPMCLRAVSYFMYHEHIASLFSLEMVQSTVDTIIHVLHNTTDQTVYLLCLWSLSKQNFDEPTHQLVPRLVEVFCLACINDLQSRKTLIKHPKAVLSRSMLKKWCHVVAKGLGSSDKHTRDASRKIFQEMATSIPPTPTSAEPTDDIVAYCMEQHALPAMHGHMAANRPLEAIHVWGFVVVLLRTKLSDDDDLLNSTFKVPEVTLRHQDSRVRVVSLQHWRSVVNIFRRQRHPPSSTVATTSTVYASLWLFRNAIVDIVMRPLVVCFRDESLATVLSAAGDTWHALVAVAIADFNAFCAAVTPLTMDTCKVVMRTSWKLWWEDMVTQVLVVLLDRIDRSDEAICVVLRDRTCDIVRRMWQVDDDESETCDNVHSSPASVVGKSLESLSVTNNSTPWPPAMMSSAPPPVERLPVHEPKSIAMLVMFQSALHCIATLLSRVSSRPKSSSGAVALCLWHGLVSRLQMALMVNARSGGEDAEIRKLHRRLMTKCFAFMLGCTQFQAKSAASLRDPPDTVPSAYDVAFPQRLKLLAHAFDKMDLQCIHDVLLASGGQLQPSLAQKVDFVMETVRETHIEEQQRWAAGDVTLFGSWLRQRVLQDDVSDVFGMASYTIVLDLVVEISSGRPQHSDTIGDQDNGMLTSVVLVLGKMATLDAISPSLQQTLTDLCHVLRSMAIKSTDADSSFESRFRAQWTALTGNPLSDDGNGVTGAVVDKAESNVSLPPSPCLMVGRPGSTDQRTPKRPPLDDDQVLVCPRPSPSGPIRPDLVECKEPFSLIKHHFPQSFRQLSGFFNIHTIGDLCAKSEADVASMSLNDPVNTVHKALDEFVGRRARLNTLANKSPMKRKLPLTYSPHPLTPSTSPYRSPKRTKMKNAMRSLTDEVMGSGGDEGGSRAKVADVVKFTVTRPDGSVRVLRPGEDSQPSLVALSASHDVVYAPRGGGATDESPLVDPVHPPPTNMDAKLTSLATKVVSHLERCDVYVEKIMAHMQGAPHRPSDGGCWTIDERTKIVVLIANIDIRLYNSIAPQGQHIFVTLSTARDFGATLLYFACVKPVVAVATTGIPLSLVVLSVRWTVLSTVAFQEINSFQSSAPSIWPAVGGVGSIYLSVCVCRELAKKVCTTTRYVCCDHLDIYRYVYGLPIPMACQVPSHMMGVFGAGLIV
ncbi:hypothetical protein DYB30_003453 [Aphanomyces astaci]|uniref:Telomere-associated protein Rif1 N-terminal domain-containing protein n=1 Tax=Aphanomyces astaci TaxID=112090 RepID=A0A397DNL5_APHAT|nr:hypothetical protein DYB30_003453 [Aphanomyces astaci]